MKMRRIFCSLLAVALVIPVFSCSRFRQDGPSPGDPRHFTVDKTWLTMRYAPAAAFPTGLDNDGEAVVADAFCNRCYGIGSYYHQQRADKKAV